MASKEIEIVIKAKDEASGTLGRIEGAFASLEGSSKNFLTQALEPINRALEIGLAAAATAAGAALAGVGAGLVQAVTNSAKFEQEMADIGAVSGASAEELEDLSVLARGLGLDRNLKIETSEAAEAIQHLVRNGVEIPDVLGGAARAVVLLANATGSEGYTQAADLATDAMNLFNLKAGDMTHVADQISGVVNESKFDLNNYHYALTNMAGTMGVLGGSFEDANAMIAAVSKNFKTGREAGTNLKVLLGRLVPITDTQTKAMGELGLITGMSAEDQAALQREVEKVEVAMANLDPEAEGYAEQLDMLTGKNSELMKAMNKGQNAFFDEQGNFKGAINLAEQLQQKIGHLSDEEQIYYMKKLFGQEAWKSAINLMDLGGEGLQRWKDKVAETSSEENAIKRMNTLGSQWEILQDIYTEFSRQVGDSAKGPLTDFVRWMQDLTTAHGPALVAWMQNLITSGLVPLLEKFKLWIGDGIWIKDWIIQMYAGFIAFKDGVLQAVAAIQSFIQPIIENISQFVSFKDVLMALGVMVGMTLVGYIGSMIAAWAPFFILLGGLTAAVIGIKTAWETDWLGIKTIVTGAITGIFGSTESLVNTLRQHFGESLTDIRNWASGQGTEWNGVKALWNDLKIVFAEVWAKIKARLEEWSGYQKLVTWFNQAKDAWEDFKKAIETAKDVWKNVSAAIETLYVVGLKLSSWLVENRAAVEGAITAFATYRTVIGVTGVVQSVMALIGALGLLNPAVLLIATAVGLVYAAFRNEWITPSPELVAATNKVKESFGILWENIKTEGPLALKEIQDWVSGTDTEFTHLTEITNSMSALWGDAWGAIKQAFFDMTNPIIEWFKQTFPTAASDLHHHWMSLKSKLGDLWDQLVALWINVTELFHSGMNQLGGWWQEHGDAVKAIVETLMSTISLVFSTALGIITDTITLFLAVLNGDWDAAGKKLVEIVTGFWELIKGVFTGAFTIITELFTDKLEEITGIAEVKMSDVWEAIKRPFSAEAITSFFSGIGGQIIGGLVSGITASIPGLSATIGTVMGMVNSIPVEEAEIHSPSKVWTGYGTAMGEGLEIGVKASIESARVGIEQALMMMGAYTDKLRYEWRDHWKDMVGTVQGAWQNIQATSEGGMARLKDFMVNGLHEVQIQGGVRFNGLHRSFASAWENARSITQIELDRLSILMSDQLGRIVGESARQLQPLSNMLNQINYEVDNLLSKYNSLGQASAVTTGNLASSSQVFNEFKIQVQSTGEAVQDVRNQIELYKLAQATIN